MNIYDIHKAGREYCQTEGSEHYKVVDKLEPIDLIIAKGFAEDFCLANIIKYASRFKATQNLNDLKKASDYSHILCGVKLGEKTEVEASKVRPKCGVDFCSKLSIKNDDDVKKCIDKVSASGTWNGFCTWRTPF